MSKPQSILASLIELRFIVGALGERLRWWPSQFTTEVGLRHLAMLFPRTTLRAAFESVSLSARREHDALLHPDAVHLFRLGSAREDALSHFLVGSGAAFQAPPGDIDALLTRLDALGLPAADTAGTGPISLGNERRVRQRAGLADLARTYAAGARAGLRPVPYFETNP